MRRQKRGTSLSRSGGHARSRRQTQRNQAPAQWRVRCAGRAVPRGGACAGEGVEDLSAEGGERVLVGGVVLRDTRIQPRVAPQTRNPLIHGCTHGQQWAVGSGQRTGHIDTSQEIKKQRQRQAEKEQRWAGFLSSTLTYQYLRAGCRGTCFRVGVKAARDASPRRESDSHQT